MSLKPPVKAQGMAQDADFTPVIFPLEGDIPFAPSLASGSSSNKGPNGLSYMERLAKKHEALARMVREEPRFLPHADQNSDGTASDERVTVLRELVREALVKADGNPADGKYIFLTQLLRLKSTSGLNGRWSGVRTDLSPPEELKGPGLGWINAKTETEWKEWERKYEAERRVKDKVENWKKTVEAPSKDSSLQESLQDAPALKGHSRTTAAVPGSKVSSVSVAVDPLKSSTPFGFSVVKRTQKTAVGKPSGSGSGNAKVPPKKPSGSASSKPGKGAHNKHIADLPEHSFIPPSFPSSQLLTSTPKHAARPSSNEPRKPDPIPHIAQLSSSEISIVPETSQQQQRQLSSPRVTKTYGRHNPSPSQPLEASASLPAIPAPSTPTRNLIGEDDSFFNTNNKRILASPTTPHNNEQRALKRARTLSGFLDSPFTPPPPPQQTSTGFIGYMNRSPRTPTNMHRIAAPAAAAAPTSSPLSFPPSSSPKKAAVPTLVDLLASAKKGKKKFPAAAIAKPLSKDKGKGKDTTKEKTPLADAEEAQQAADSYVQQHRIVSPVTPFLFPEAEVIPMVEEELEEETVAKEVEDDSVHANFHDLSGGAQDPHSPSFDPYPEPTPMPYDDPSLIPVDAMSPAKSLSSLAGSDSEDEGDDNDDNEKSVGFSFRPQVTSTQQRGPFAGTSIGTSAIGRVGGGGGNTEVGVQESQPSHNLSQITKDSWESIYAPPSNPKSKSSSSKEARSKSPSEQQPRHYQLPQATPSSNPFAYNSQFATSVSKSVYDVDRLLEQDVELAYSGWIRDPYADDVEDDGNLEPDSSP
ncbi:hypothetical protein CVT25_000976 [Psilocybe cyanescens]|uniref:Uncharacterized protein n=1 Tax=Psilocybe cyanescens TaxID=93625 RepID=A0A409XMC0_PSICY|nr:hypothetical protein CVT25_000976 [Psilocybe cyanescens]